MTKRIWATILGIVAFLGIAGTVWKTSDYWHGYCATETVHEQKQDEKIDLAMNQGQLALAQQRLQWLEQRIWGMQNQYGCPNCSGMIKRTYDDYVREYNALQQKINKLMGR